MSKNTFTFDKHLSTSEKFVIILSLLMPFALLMSIFIAEVLSLIICLIFIFWFFIKKNFFSNFIIIKKPIILLLFLYLIIMISMITSQYLDKSFLASFFYFRFIFYSLAIFFIFYNYESTLKLYFVSLLLLFILIILDSSYEILQINELFGLKLDESRFKEDTYFHITSFFNNEKKLGSFIVRLLPLLISFLVFFKFKTNKKIFLINFIIFISGLLIVLTSERTALVLYLIFFILFFKFIEKKIYFSLFLSIVLLTVTIIQPRILQKIYYTTLYQIGFSKDHSKYVQNDKFSIYKLNYLSEEHEKLIKSGYEIFKENSLTGSGVKTYHETCNEIKIKKSLDILCSTHPHNTYIQILSDTGIFAALIISFIFIYVLKLNFNLFFKNDISKNQKAFYVLNIGILLNLMPFVPSGSFYNNWISFMIYLPLPFWLFLNHQIQKEQLNLK